MGGPGRGPENPENAPKMGPKMGPPGGGSGTGGGPKFGANWQKAVQSPGTPVRAGQVLRPELGVS